MVRTLRQMSLAEVWDAEGSEALLSLMARSTEAREHELIHELHAQSLECERSAPQVSAKLHRVAGLLAEIHAGLRAAETVDDVESLLDWQAQASWRWSEPMRELAMVAGRGGMERWPWELGALPVLQAELDALLDDVRALIDVPVAERLAQVERQPQLRSSALLAWLTARAESDAPEAAEFVPLRQAVQRWKRVRSVAAREASGRSELVVQAELMELWHRLDPTLDRTCEALRAEVVAGRRPLADALRTVVGEERTPERMVHRRIYLLHHLLDEPSAAIRRAALGACAREVVGPEVQGFDRMARGTLVQRWAASLELHWRVLPDPIETIEMALRVIDKTLPSLLDGAANRLGRELLLVRARLLRRLAGWRDGTLQEAIRAYTMALEAPVEGREDPVIRARALGELAGLRRARRELAAQTQDREIRALYDEALEGLGGSVVVRARVLADYATYLAQPLRLGPEDAEHALSMADHAVRLLGELPPSVRDHPLMRGDEAEHLIGRANLQLEVGAGSLSERRAAAVADYEAARARLGDGEDLLGGLTDLNLACVALAQAPRGEDEIAARAHDMLERAAQGLGQLPLLHARAVVERVMLSVRSAPDDSQLRERCIQEVEGVLHRLPVGADKVVRGRLEQQLGELCLQRDGLDDVPRAANHFAAARGALAEGGAVRLAVEAARDYAQTQLHLHAGDGDAAALTRGAVVLEQATLLAERAWVSRPAGAPHEALLDTLEGVLTDLAWFHAQLGRPAEMVVHTVTRAKHHRPTPSLHSLVTRAERASILRPAYFDPLARRLPAPPTVPARPATRSPTMPQLRDRLQAFIGANPEAVAIDLTATRWGTVMVCAGPDGLRYGTVRPSREAVRRWVWGHAQQPGWSSTNLSLREVGDHDPADLDARWREASARLAEALGARVLVPGLAATGAAIDRRVIVVAAGVFTALPLEAAELGERPLGQVARGLVRAASFASLPAGPLPAARPDRSLCVLAGAELSSDSVAAVEELGDVVRLLASARAEIEVLARLGTAGGEAVIQPSAKARARTTVGGTPSIAAVRERLGHIDHFFYGGHGRQQGPVLLDDAGQPTPWLPETLRAGPRWKPGSSVLLSAATHYPPPVDDAELWPLLHALASAGVGYTIVAARALPPELAHDFTRGFYTYWALGRSLPEAVATALNNVAGSEPYRRGAFMVWLGASSPAEG